MQTHTEKELSDLREKLLTMASYSEAAVRKAVDSLILRDSDMARAVKANDDAIDRLEIEVDETAIQLLAKAPLATNLRLIAMAMKISQNVERVGDEATKIAKRALELNQEPPLKHAAAIPPLADMALQLLRRALDAFVNQDATSARQLIPEDQQIDQANKEIHRALARQMLEDPETITRALHLMVVAKSLERIADHAKNIAEEIVYVCEAKDIRHSAKAID